jgi:hypothetical protein
MAAAGSHPPTIYVVAVLGVPNICIIVFAPPTCCCCCSHLLLRYSLIMLKTGIGFSSADSCHVTIDHRNSFQQWISPAKTMELFYIFYN